MPLLIKNGSVIDPSAGIDDRLDVLIAADRIKEIKKGIVPSGNEIEEIDANNLIVVPGLIDMHTHLREPGHEYKETIRTGALAAA